MKELRERLTEVAAGLGVRLFGVADLEKLSRTEPGLFDELGRSFPRAISLGVRLSDAVLDGILDRPTPLYFHLYRQANYQLDRAGFQIALELQEAGFAALAVPASQVIGECHMRGHISHREIAWAAGLGWRGRNNLLVNARAGARLRLATVLTDAPLSADGPVREDCGNCRACIAACPAGAIKDDPADFDLDACYRKLCEFRRLPYIGQHICGVCVKACRSDNPRG
jgi:epoxyqueuosine reductase